MVEKKDSELQEIKNSLAANTYIREICPDFEFVNEIPLLERLAELEGIQ